MTQPIPEDLRDAQEHETVAFEEATAALVTGAFALAVADGVRRFLAGASNVINLGASLRDLRNQAQGWFAIQPNMRRQLVESVRNGVRIGVRHASEHGGISVTPPSPKLRDRELAKVVGLIDKRAEDRLRAARRAARQMPITTLSSATRITAIASGAANGARADARWSATRSIAAGTAYVAEETGMQLMWVAERNACLACLAYSGHVVDPGELFPEDLTFGDPTHVYPPVAYPPRHPNCRCRVELYSPNEGADPAEALRREAQRSVARGLSDFESEPAAIRAVDRLLRKGSSLPKTVLQRAARDARRGSFSPRPT